MASSKLIKMLKKAHAGELAAYYAYEGHKRAVAIMPGSDDWRMLRQIQHDELAHRRTVKEILEEFGEKPSKIRDTVFTVIGRVLGFLCHFTDYITPMKGALIIERIGVTNYSEMGAIAARTGHIELAMILFDMASTEMQHQLFFEELIDGHDSGRDQMQF